MTKKGLLITYSIVLAIMIGLILLGCWLDIVNQTASIILVFLAGFVSGHCIVMIPYIAITL